MTTKVRTQNPLNFTVQIRNKKSETIVGSGVIISLDGKIVTCAHVVRAAGLEPRDAGQKKIPVYFPQLEDEAKERKAVVIKHFSEHDDDIVLLQVRGEPPPLKKKHVAILGPAEDSFQQPFVSFGFRQLGDYFAAYADGKIMGSVPPPRDRSFQVGPVQLKSSEINRGMSGAGVLDSERNVVVGFISETWFPNASTKDRDTAWAVNARVLALEPFNIPVKEEFLEKGVGPQPELDPEAAKLAAVPNPGVALEGAPPPLDEWVGRGDVLGDIDDAWLDPDKRAIGLIGFGGEGKSSVARNWLDQVQEKEDNAPGGIFWWSFDDRPDVEQFFVEAVTFLTNENKDYLSTLKKTKQRMNALAAMLVAGRYLFILDGLEALQHQDGDRFGLLRDENLRDFIHLFAGAEHDSFCLITSRVPVLDLIDFTTYRNRDVNRLSTVDGVELMTRLGVKGKKDAITEVVEQWDGHALTISLLSAYLVEHHEGNIDHITDIPTPTADEPKYERVRRVLGRYDENLSEVARSFLTIFSAFRLPITEAAFDAVFQAQGNSDTLNAPLARLKKAKFLELVSQMTRMRIIRFDSEAQEYFNHILIREHYNSFLDAAKPDQLRGLHTNIAKYYLLNRANKRLLAGNFARGALQGLTGGNIFGSALLGSIFALTSLVHDKYLREAFHHGHLAGMKFLES